MAEVGGGGGGGGGGSGSGVDSSDCDVDLDIGSISPERASVLYHRTGFAVLHTEAGQGYRLQQEPARFATGVP